MLSLAVVMSEQTVAQLGPAIRPGEQMVLAAECDRADCSFDRVGVEFNTAIAEEAAKGLPASEAISDGVGEAAAGREVHELSLKPNLECSHEW